MNIDGLSLVHRPEQAGLGGLGLGGLKRISGEISLPFLSLISLENELIRSCIHLDCTGRIARNPGEQCLVVADDRWRSDRVPQCEEKDPFPSYRNKDAVSD